jgi:hypothetical protein
LKHQDRILEQYTELTGQSVTRETFESRQVPEVLEGGLTTEEYANLLMPARHGGTRSSNWPCPSKPRRWISTCGHRKKRKTRRAKKP